MAETPESLAQLAGQVLGQQAAQHPDQLPIDIRVQQAWNQLWKLVIHTIPGTVTQLVHIFRSPWT